MLFAANFSLFSLAPFKNQVWTRRYQVPGFVFGCWGLKNLFWFIVIVFSFFMKIIVIVFVRLDFNLILYGPGDRVARGAEIHHGDKDRNRILDCRHASFLSPVSSSNSAHSCLALPNVLVLTVLEIDTISIS